MMQDGRHNQYENKDLILRFQRVEAMQDVMKVMMFLNMLLIVICIVVLTIVIIDIKI